VRRRLIGAKEETGGIEVCKRLEVSVCSVLLVGIVGTSVSRVSRVVRQREARGVIETREARVASAFINCSRARLKSMVCA
jgi:hypothetical protein